MTVLFGLLQILGALGIFIYGMKLMSEGIQNAAGDKLRNILKGMTKNKGLGILTGFFITTLVQSSSATTVMVVSFVNAGLLTLTESLGVIMGANIGTTVTLWIIAVLGKLKITKVAIALIGISFPFIFSKTDKIKHFAEFILGFGILFIGLDFLKDAVPDIRSNPDMLSFVQNFTDLSIPYASILLFVLIGTILTLVVQSSSAATAITLTLLIQGWIPFELACAMILGENIGTTVTANIAAAIGNVHAKRAARFHFLFNVLGVIWILILFIPYTNFIHSLLDSDLFNRMAAFLGKGNERIGLAIFHTTFNVLNVLFLMFFTKQMAAWVIKMVPTTTDEDEEFKLKHISTGLMSTPELSIVEAKKELNQFAKLIDKMSSNVHDLFFEKQKKYNKLIDKISAREDLTDRLDLELNNFLAKVSESDISNSASNQIKQMLSISGDLERIADIFYVMTKNFERLKKEEVSLPANAKEEIKEMMQLVIKAISIMRNNLNDTKEPYSIEQIVGIEREINAKRKEIFTNHFLRLEKGVYTPRQGVLFIDFVNRCERVGDHVVNVHESILGKNDLFSDME